MLKKVVYTATAMLKRLNVLLRTEASKLINMLSVFISRMRNQFTVIVLHKDTRYSGRMVTRRLKL
jgi:hypothetical protein